MVHPSTLLLRGLAAFVVGNIDKKVAIAVAQVYISLHSEGAQEILEAGEFRLPGFV